MKNDRENWSGIYIFHFYSTKNKLHGGNGDLTGKYEQQYYVNKPFIFLIVLLELLKNRILTCITLTICSYFSDIT